MLFSCSLFVHLSILLQLSSQFDVFSLLLTWNIHGIKVYTSFIHPLSYSHLFSKKPCALDSLHSSFSYFPLIFPSCLFCTMWHFLNSNPVNSILSLTPQEHSHCQHGNIFNHWRLIENLCLKSLQMYKILVSHTWSIVYYREMWYIDCKRDLWGCCLIWNKLSKEVMEVENCAA